MSDVQRRDYELDDDLAVDTPARLKALGDPLRMRITELVLERAMSVTELAERLDRPRGTVAYHVGVLHDAGLIQVVSTRRVRAVEERFYGRVARTYVFSGDSLDSDFIGMFLADIERAQQHPDIHPTAGFATIRHARIPPERAEEYVHRLEALAAEFVDEPRDGDIDFGLFMAIYPTAPDRTPNP